MKLKFSVISVSLLLYSAIFAASYSIAQQTKTDPPAVSLAKFVNATLKEMELPGNIVIPGLGDAEKILVKNDKSSL